jgi:hypothetical protein
MNSKRKTFFLAETLSRRDGENPKSEAPIQVFTGILHRANLGCLLPKIHKQFGISNFQNFKTLFAIVFFNI